MNSLKSYGRWVFAEFRDVFEIEADFKAKVESAFAGMVEAYTGRADDAVAARAGNAANLPDSKRA